MHGRGLGMVGERGRIMWWCVSIYWWLDTVLYRTGYMEGSYSMAHG